MPGSVRVSCPTSGVVSLVASLIGCCSCLRGAVGTESGLTVSSFTTDPCCLCPLWFVLPPVGGSDARGSLVTFSAGSSVCGCCVLPSAPSASHVGAVGWAYVVASGSILTFVIGSSGCGFMRGCACTWFVTPSAGSCVMVHWSSVVSAVSCSAPAPTCCCLPRTSIRWYVCSSVV